MLLCYLNKQLSIYYTFYIEFLLKFFFLKIYFNYCVNISIFVLEKKYLNIFFRFFFYSIVNYIFIFNYFKSKLMYIFTFTNLVIFFYIVSLVFFYV